MNNYLENYFKADLEPKLALRNVKPCAKIR